MAFEDKVIGLMIGLVFLVVLASFLGGIDPTLSGELNNTAAHPNGPLALTIIGFIVLAFAIGLLIGAFKTGKTAVEDFRERFRQE